MLAGIVGDCLVALHIFPQRQTGSVERDFRLNGLPRLLKKMPLAVKASFIHDGAAAYFFEMYSIKTNTRHDKRIE